MSVPSEEKVSVIIPTYNRETTIARAIRSVIDQTWPNFEIIVVDDCSTDHTREIVEGIGDDRIRYIYLEQNGGASRARNTGIRHAECEYIAFLDSDDEWLPEKLEKQMHEMLRMPEQVGVVYCRMWARQEGRDPIVCPPLSMGRERLAGNLLAELVEDNLIGTPAILARKKCLEQVGGFDERLRCLEDWDMVCRIAEQWEIGFVDEVLAEVHYSAGSVTSNIRGHFEARCRLIGRYRHLLAQKNVLDKKIMEMLIAAQEDGYLEETKMLLSEALNL